MEESTRPRHDTGPHVHICPYNDCSKAFSKSSRLTQHIRSHTGERPFVCEVEGCLKSYSRAAHLKRHQDTTHCFDTDDGESETFRCCHKDCEQTFVSKENLLKHTTRKHEDLPKYKCKEEGCGRTFSKKSRLRAHSYEHQGVLPFQCHYEGCKKMFKQKSHVDRHAKSHDGHTCSEPNCDKWFLKWSLMRRHITVDHATVYTCDQCQKTLPTKPMLREHQDTHRDTREKCVCPYDGCPRSYFVKRNLTAHIKSYHIGKRFQCEVENCGRTFVTKQKQQLHEKLHDPNRPLPKKKTKKTSHRKVANLLAKVVTGHKGRKSLAMATDVSVHDSDLDVDEEEEMESSMNLTLENSTDTVTEISDDLDSQAGESTDNSGNTGKSDDATKRSVLKYTSDVVENSIDNSAEKVSTEYSIADVISSQNGTNSLSAADMFQQMCNENYEPENGTRESSVLNDKLIISDIPIKEQSRLEASCLQMVEKMCSDCDICQISENGHTDFNFIPDTSSETVNMDKNTCEDKARH